MVTTAGDAVPSTELTAFLSEHDLTGRWGVTLRTVQRRINEAKLQAVTIADRTPHFYRGEVEACETAHAWPVVRSAAARRTATDTYRVCIAHRKGGVSKTTTTFFLSRELASMGKRVLMRDLDSQRTLTNVLRALGTPMDAYGRMPFLKRMVLVPDGSPLPFRADVEVLDTPPALDDAVAGIRRADGLIVPAQPELVALTALRDMLEFLRDTRRQQQPDLRIIGVLPTRVVGRWDVQRKFLEEIELLAAEYDVPMLTPIPESRHVQTYSTRGRLWRPVAERILEAMAERNTDGR